MAGIRGEILRLSVVQIVEAKVLVGLKRAPCRALQGRPEKLWVHLVQQPGERLALKLRLQLKARAQVTDRLVGLVVTINELNQRGILVEPNSSDSDAVPSDNTWLAFEILALTIGILPKNMAHVRTSGDFQTAAAQPNPEAELNLLSSVEMQAGIVSSQFEKPVSPNREEPTCHDRRWLVKHVARTEVIQARRNLEILC
jgi:hypothetical protein